MARTTRALGALGLAVGLLGAGPAHAVEVGGAVGVTAGNVDAVGAQLNAYVGLPKLDLLHFGGDVEYYFTDAATVIALDPNLQVRFLRVPLAAVYGIVGVNVLWSHLDLGDGADSATDVGANLGVGGQLNLGPIRPFAELRGTIHGSAYAEALAGLRIGF